MPTYEYNRDYPFAAFITNLGKYNEGELIGEWVKFPTTAEEIKAALDSIGIGQKDDFGYAYELSWKSWHLYFHALCPGGFSGTGRSRRNQTPYQICSPL